VIIVSEGKDSGKFSIYLEYGKLLDFFKIANSITHDGRLQFEDFKMSVVEINMHNTVGLQLIMYIPKIFENTVSLKNLFGGTKKKYLVEFKDILNVLSSFNCESSDLIECKIDEINNIFVFLPRSSTDGYNRCGYVPICENPITRRGSLELIDDFVLKYMEDYTFMQIDVNCAELQSAIKSISDMEFNSWGEGVILMGTEKGLTVSSSTSKGELGAGNRLKTAYLSITIPFDGDMEYLKKDVFIGRKPEKEWVASLFEAEYFLNLLNILPKNCILTVSVATNCVGMIETKMRGISLRYGIAPRYSDNANLIIEDAYAKWMMLRD